ncbi:hypothetical protein [Rhodohalobacter sp. 8-1]|uniref:hypothetical protein n=1 Tax=Rhodohalobacter sp. 8-1 TaxID=3131972 RepID=UPI0030ED606B
MKRLLLLLIIALAGFYRVDAQTSKNPGEVFIQQASFDHNDAVKQFTGDFVTMFEMDFDAFAESGENSNTAIVNQYGNNNTTGITQNGWGNKALVNLLGDNNTTGLLQQGSDNQFILNLEGNDNTLTGTQQGSQNKLRMDLIGSGTNQTFTQMGNNLTIELIDNGTGGVPLQIEQRGDGASVTVENY